MRVRDMVKSAVILQVLTILTGVVAYLMFTTAQAFVQLPAGASDPTVWAIPGALAVFGAYIKLS
jgi:hypothetical protein